MDTRRYGSEPGSRSRSGRLAIVSIVCALAVLALGAYLLHRRDDAAQRPQRPVVTAAPSRSPRVAVVRYEISGRGRATITYTDPGRSSNVVLAKHRLPWHVELPRQAVDFVEVNATREAGSYDKEWTARVLVDGVEACAETNSAYINVGCQALVPPV
ncbi:MmpS family transport accessory protein [Plantactinospora siamensis]|uniref:MmpS family transport accessory protein n=1 Tax=Plantactinospora siamensis TaxID=555372 RepID=A0ABV6P6H0_9ACTN